MFLSSCRSTTRLQISDAVFGVFLYSHRGSSKPKKYNKCEGNHETAFIGEEMTQAINHHLGKGVCRVCEREDEWGWVG